MLRILTYFLLGLVLIGVSVFAVQNQQAIALKFVNLESINLPLGIALTISAGLGALLTTALQVRRRNLSQSVPKFTVPTQTAKSKPAQVNSKKAVKSTIADFDDEVDDDWV